ncbi:hypothetical protein GCM10009832_14520 [Dietzia kunjamensis subsp. schimae]
MARDDVDVAGLGVGSGEDARAVHTLAAGEHLVEVLARVDGEGEGFEPAVAADVAQIDLAQLQLLDGPDEVGSGELGGRLAQQSDERVGFQRVDGHAPFYQRRGRLASGRRGLRAAGDAPSVTSPMCQSRSADEIRLQRCRRRPRRRCSIAW